MERKARWLTDPPQIFLRAKIMKDIFLPPGVQAKMFARFGRCPRQAGDETAAKIEALWLRRNNAPEEDLDEIDNEMTLLAEK